MIAQLVYGFYVSIGLLIVQWWATAIVALVGIASYFHYREKSEAPVWDAARVWVLATVIEVIFLWVIYGTKM
jgi:hypothetical protein